MDPVFIGLLFGIFISAVFALIERKDKKEQKKYFIKAFLYFFLSIIVLGFILKFFPLG